MDLENNRGKQKWLGEAEKSCVGNTVILIEPHWLPSPQLLERGDHFRIVRPQIKVHGLGCLKNCHA